MTADVGANTYPPYNIEKSGENAYRISVAVAGFSEDELSVELREGQLLIAARKAEDAGDEAEKRSYLHRGIAERAFEKRFQLADHMRVVGAETKNGLLHVDLIREVPEALKPRKIAISNSAKSSGRSRKAAITQEA